MNTNIFRGSQLGCPLWQICLLALFCLAGIYPAAATPAAANAHVFLVQNSGWMEPFFTDPRSAYKALITELALAISQENDLMVLAAFNQSLAQAPSPKALASFKVESKTQRARLDSALTELKLAKKPNGALADTDLNEAVSVAMQNVLVGKAGLIWLLTNNKNSPNNDQATHQRNREFYKLIHHGERIKKALAFPLQMPVQGKVYQAKGLMLYVFAIDEQGQQQLDQLLASGKLQKVITEPAARIKPLDLASVRLTPTKVGDSPGVVFSIKPGGRLLAAVSPDATQANAKVEWQLENTLYPYTIASAQLSARSLLANEARTVQLGSSTLQDLAPGQSVAISSVMQLPLAKIPSKWSKQALATAGSAYDLSGTLTLELSEQQLVLSSGFKQRMDSLFPGDPLPDIFTPPTQIKLVQAQLPIDVRVKFGLAPLIVLIAGLLGLLALLAGALFFATRGRLAYLTVEGEPRTMHSQIGSSLPIFDKNGVKIAVLKTNLFGHQLLDLREGAQVRLGR